VLSHKHIIIIIIIAVVVVIRLICIPYIRRCRTYYKPCTSRRTHAINIIYTYIIVAAAAGTTAGSIRRPFNLRYYIIYFAIHSLVFTILYIYYLLCYSLTLAHITWNTTCTAVYGHSAYMCVCVCVCVWPMERVEPGGLKHIIIIIIFGRVCVWALIMPAPHRWLPPHWRWIENNQGGKKRTPLAISIGFARQTRRTTRAPFYCDAKPSSNRNTHTNN